VYTPYRPPASTRWIGLVLPAGKGEDEVGPTYDTRNDGTTRRNTVAADTTLLALPNTPANLETAEYLTWVRRFPDDDEYRDPETGERFGNIAGDSRESYELDFYSTWPLLFDWLEVGPTYWCDLYDDAVQSRLRQPVVLTRSFTSELLVTMNRRYGSYRTYWNRPRRGLGPGMGKVGRGYARGGGRARYQRVARLQDVKRWLNAHEGWVCWAEVW
jgi:hypothetical protein